MGIELKKAYCTRENLERKCAQWLDKVAEQTGRDLTKLPPHPSALLIVDAQRFFFDSSSHAFVPSSSIILPKIQELISSFKTVGAPIAFTRHGHLGDVDSVNHFPMSFVWRMLLNQDDPCAEIIDSLDISLGKVFKKQTYSAFEGTKIKEWLSDQSVKTVYLCGVTTHLCLETTARAAFTLGFFPVIVADTSCSWKEEQHLRSLVAISDGIGSVIDTDTLVRRIAHDC